MERLFESTMDRRDFLKKAAVAATAVGVSSWIQPRTSGAQTPVSPVALRRCHHYDRNLIYETLGQMFDDLGGLPDLVGGKTLAVKINGVGAGSYDHSMHSSTGHSTHPEVVYAACRHFIEAGAAKVNVMESHQTTGALSTQLVTLGYNQAEFEALGNGSQVRFYSTRGMETDTTNPDTGFNAYARVDVTSTGFGSGDPYLFDYFYFNKMWVAPKADIIVSIAKMKGHAVAGVTLSMKNLFGCPPPTIYGGPNLIDFSTGPNESVTQARNNSCHFGYWHPVGERAGHGILPQPSERMPRLIADLNRALPIRLGIIDGIVGLQAEMNAQAFTALATPGVLAAGYNPVCLDSVCAAVMGCDPQSPAFTGLFSSGQNHIALAAAKGLGTNDLSQITVLGEAIEDVRYDFFPTVFTPHV